MIKHIVLIFISIFFIFGIISYPYLPDKIASHWNAKGEVDGYLPKLSIFLLPLIYSGISSLFLIIPRIDPLGVNIEKFRKYYDWFIIIFSIFFPFDIFPYNFMEFRISNKSFNSYLYRNRISFLLYRSLVREG
ncbi:MAG: DUF1648 domain-containing protein [Candidatus Methanomethylicaceae archaeon]